MDQLFDLDDENENNLYNISKINIVDFSEVKDKEIKIDEQIKEIDKIDQNTQSDMNLKNSDEILENKTSESVLNQNCIENNNNDFELVIKKNVDVFVSEGIKKSKVYAELDNIDVKEYDKLDHIIKFPFELDDFQKRSIIRIENKQNILVCAHTSSGKTVVAEYAIAQGKKFEKRVFYTSPIKALSNQKYREFKEKFGDVGILTGDVSLNSDAQTLIMTTEILQNSLYKSSNLLNHVEWIIFDEVHYINDNERGHVWEEILILLPPSIGIIMLSATIPNYEDFAKWVGRIKNTVIYMQITNKRVVPLEHKIYLDEKNVNLVKDKNDKVDNDMIHKSLTQLEIINKHTFNKMGKGNQSYINKGYNTKNDSYSNQSFNNKSNQQKMTSNKILETCSYLIKNQLTPAVIFVFSIKKIDEYSRDLSMRASDYNWCSKEDSSKIIKFYDRCINVLNEKDRKLNQIVMIKEILKTGVGVHHAGLLPIVKEIIEVLYSKGLIKILFATTSFSIGLNMPTRTVIFTEISKFNDQQKEILSSSEYLQMCGRAGRRGIDEKGTIFILLGDKTNPPKADDIAKMMKDGGTVVESKFRLSYKTIISILSRDIKEINQFFKESFLENKKMSSMQDSITTKNKLKSELKGLETINCIYDTLGDDLQYISRYYEVNMKLKKAKSSLWEANDIYNYFKDNPGSLVICKPKFLKGKRIVGMLVRFYYKPTYDNQLRIFYAEKASDLKVQIEKFDKANYESISLKDKKVYYIQVDLSELDDILDEKYQLKKTMIITDGEDYSYLDKTIVEKYANSIIDNNLKIDSSKIADYSKLTKNDINCFKMISDRDNLTKELEKSKCHQCTLRNDHYETYSIKLRPILVQLEESEKNIDTENLKYSNEFNSRIKVLKDLNYVSIDDCLELKGKAARELSTTDCVMMTETLLSGVLDKLDVKEKIAFMSGFAFNKNEIEIDDPKISKNFTNSIDLFQNKLKKIIEIESKYDFVENKYNRRSTFSVAYAILCWMKGDLFKNVQEISNLEEGKLYTLIMRLYQLCDEIINFYKVLGLEENVKEYEEAKLLIMRDIINCKSLYVQDVDFTI